MTAFTGLIIALACAAIGIFFGIVWALWVLKQPAGNDRMREIAAAIQQGAKAYLNRQYTTIAIVGVVLFVVIGFALDWHHRVRFRGRRDPLGPGRLHRHERLGARQRAHRGSRAHRHQRSAGDRLPRRRDHRPAGGRPRPARRRRLLLVPAARHAPHGERVPRRR